MKNKTLIIQLEASGPVGAPYGLAQDIIFDNMQRVCMLEDSDVDKEIGIMVDKVLPSIRMYLVAMCNEYKKK